MNKELQDLAWSVLPKEFKEEVKKIYSHNPGAKPMPKNTSRGKAILRDIFGHDNLTSDTEGEEMLTCEKSKVVKLYNKFQKDGTFTCLYAAGVLDTLFGSKCMPDELNEDNFAKSKPKPSEPKFKKGDMVHCKSFGYEGDYKVLEYTGGSLNCYDCIDKHGAYYRFYEPDLIPYTGPNETFTDERKSQCKSQDFDAIIKNGFREHNRLHIAAILAAGMLANDHNFYPTDRALELTDALIDKCEKGVNNA